MTEWLIFIMGIILVFIGFMVMMIDLILRSPRDVESRVRGGGVVIVGPLPIVFGSDRRTALIMAIVGLVMTITLVVLYLVLGGKL